jgi:hypothetical protein
VVAGRGKIYVWELKAGAVVKFRTIRPAKDGVRSETGGDFPGGCPIDKADMTEKLLGPTKNLRAPTLRIGGTLVVGFSEDAYRHVLGE